MTALDHITYSFQSHESLHTVAPTSVPNDSVGHVSAIKSDLPTGIGATPELQQQVEALKYFLNTAPASWDSGQNLKRFLLPNGEYISCVLWHDLFHISGTDIVRTMVFRFQAFGRPVRNMKKFEEGIFSDLRNLKPGVDASLEDPRSPFLEMLYKNSCIRTQKKQKVFYWFSVPHDSLFTDALERDLKREALGQEPTTKLVSPTEASAAFLPHSLLHTAHRNSASTPHRKDSFSLHSRMNNVASNDSWPSTPDYGSPVPTASFHVNGPNSARFSDIGTTTLYPPAATRARSTSTSGLVTGLDSLMMRSDNSADDHSHQLPTPRYMNPANLYRNAGHNNEQPPASAPVDKTVIYENHSTHRDSDPYAGYYGYNNHAFSPMDPTAVTSEMMYPTSTYVAPRALFSAPPLEPDHDPAPLPRSFSMTHELYPSPKSADGTAEDAASLRNRRFSSALSRRGQRRGSVGSKSPSVSESRIERVRSASAVYNRDKTTRGPRNFGSILNSVGTTSSPLSAAVTLDDDVEILHSVSSGPSSSPFSAAATLPSDDIGPFAIRDDVVDVKADYLMKTEYHRNTHAPAPMHLNDRMIIDAPSAVSRTFSSPAKMAEINGRDYPNNMDHGYHSSFALEANTRR